MSVNLIELHLEIIYKALVISRICRIQKTPLQRGAENDKNQFQYVRTSFIMIDVQFSKICCQSKKLSALVAPGGHESCTYIFVKCATVILHQDLNIYKTQLQYELTSFTTLDAQFKTCFEWHGIILCLSVNMYYFAIDTFFKDIFWTDSLFNSIH